MTPETVTMEVSDRRGKYPVRRYTVDVAAVYAAYGLGPKDYADDWAYLVTGHAGDQYIRDVGHRPIGPRERSSSYHARFAVRVMAKAGVLVTA